MTHAYQAAGLYLGNKDITEAMANVTGKAHLMTDDGINGITFHNVWTGTPTAVLKFYATNDPRALNVNNTADVAAADWVEITADLTFDNPAGGAANDMVIISNSRFAAIRMDVTGLSSSGNFTSWTCSHGAG